MDLLKKQQFYNNIQEARNEYSEIAKNYQEVSDHLTLALEKLKTDLDYDKSVLYSNSQMLCDKLKKQTLENRQHFVNVNKFNNSDLEILSGLLVSEIDFSTPTLELFPGTGQFLPYTVASEPLFVADRYMEICEESGKSLNNDFYVERRLRKYKVPLYSLRQLPHKVFGLVYCFNEFFQADQEYILRWSRLIYDLLIDGGKFIFNFMPDDQVWSIQHNLYMDFSVVDYHKLIEQLQLQGYVIEDCKINQTKSSYIVCKKPGVRPPRIKLSGSIAQII